MESAIDWMFSLIGIFSAVIGLMIIAYGGVFAYRNSLTYYQGKVECWKALEQHASAINISAISDQGQDVTLAMKEGAREDYLNMNARATYPIPYRIYSITFFLMGLSVLSQGVIIAKFGSNIPDFTQIFLITSFCTAILNFLLYINLPKIRSGEIVYNPKRIWFFTGLIIALWIICILGELSLLANPAPVSAF